MKMQFLLSLMLLCLLHVHPTLSGGYLLLEYRALLSVKSSINDPQSALSTWNASTSHCNWTGITCHPSSRRVTVLDISNLQLSGTLSSDLAHLRFLSELSVALNQFSGAIPAELSSLSALRVLDLSSNSFHGAIPEFICDMPELEELQLGENNFTGIIPQRLGKNGKLQLLDLSLNNLTGTLPPDMCFGNRLEFLSTEENSLVGPIPDALGRCESLSNIQMGRNFLNGSMPRDLFGLPNLTHVMLQKNRLAGKFPTFSRNDSKLEMLDISDNQIHGELPSWIWRLPYLQILNLSYNYLETLDLNSPNTSQSSLYIIDLQSNQFEGQLSSLPLHFPDSTNLYRRDRSRTVFFSVSRNKFDGTIPTSLCSIRGDGFVSVGLDLSHNRLTGAIPQCLIGMRTLGVLDLGKNNLTGKIPDSFPFDCNLQILDLNGNQLEGELPKSLASCFPYLRVLDIGNNFIQDTFPCYLKNMDVLGVLILRSNQFYGSINCLDANTTWSNLQILDLASNKFEGKFPIRYFSSLKAMTGTKEVPENNGVFYQSVNSKHAVVFDLPYQNRVNVTLKALDLEFVKILPKFSSLDLSSNSFNGHIPREIGEFKVLHVLNLSHNAFMGQIPQALGKMSVLESLDLSSNKLIGEIPRQLADGLIFLAFLNLSFNQLVGKIPQMNQFHTFLENSFEGNIGLCDFPMKEKCIHEELGPSAPPSEDSHSYSGNSINWDFLSVELGFVFGFGIFTGPLIFWTRWRKRYYKYVDDILFKMFPQTYIRIENHRSRAHRNQGRQARRNQGGR
ncbi:hypothetical protein I3843_Q000600 [Carya illinoinensis]|uniref:Leucine-rich repeat-containing N-terminal plant-type domain-containing protein n=1 Tax=Carya illinoinensis TaxID=32201 RepID=A0A922ECJ2_CARIL|nr:hypothetical protein I3843_Q000600 [Carya illinoinensis]KAG6701101.1 hypothetical protein I3842_08G148100 [Carya illinoinensis]